MPTHYDQDDDLQDTGARDREISLGTGTVLGIFLALALVCSLFFGLGYSMGRRSSPGASLAATPRSATAAYSASEKSPAASADNDPAPPENQVTQPLSSSANSSAGRTSTPPPAAHEHPASAAKPSPGAAVLPVSAPSVSANVAPVPLPAEAGLVFVQVAAVSRKEDAELLLSALRRRGYTGLLRQQPQDKLLHVQLGPYPTKKEAEAMRQRLITDGYNPILK